MESTKTHQENTIKMTTPTATAARPKLAGGSSHFYSLDGQPQHTVPKADGSGSRPTTLADARKNNWLPSTTTILKLLDRPALTNWLIEQSCLAILTAPRKEGEPTDAFVQRVLHEEKQQDQEAKIARDKGTAIHDALDAYFSGLEVPPDMDPWIRPVLDALLAFGQKASSEVILVGDGYAGQADLLQDCGEWWRLWDFKGTKKLPDPAKGAWSDHRLQLAAYAAAFQAKLRRAGQVKPILVGNIYISSINPGEFVICEHESWEEAYTDGFAPLVRHWQWINRYKPQDPNASRSAPPQPQVALHLQAEVGKLKQENEQLRAELARCTNPGTGIPGGSELQNVPYQPGTAKANVEEKDPNEPAVIPETVKELKKAGRKVAWSTGTLAPSNGPQGIPLPGSGAPGTPSPMVEKAPTLPPGVIPGKLVNGPDGRPVWQPGKAQA